MGITIQTSKENEEDSIIVNVKNMNDKIMRAFDILKIIRHLARSSGH